MNVGKLFIFSFCFSFCLSMVADARTRASFSDQKMYFIENAGQVKDQDGNVRQDIQFVLKGQGMNVFVGDGKLHYQFTRHESCSENYANALDSLQGMDAGARELRKWTDKTSCTVETYRVDVALVGANPYAQVLTEESLDYYENFVRPGCQDGIQARACKRITYKNVYPGIDWVLYIHGNKLEHEFVVGPDGDPSKISLTYNGQQSLNLNDDGSLTAVTPMGQIREHAPVCYAAGSKEVIGNFKLNNNVLSYDLGKYDGALVIDPIVEWGTYYGWDSSSSPVYGMVFDQAANVYVCGLTYSNLDIASTGCFQYTYGGLADAYLVKFDSSGNRLWATYFGGDQGDWGTGVTMDTSGYIYLTGATASLSSIATTGAHQTTYGGGLWDAYLAKFTPTGGLLWATYYGGSGADIPYSACSDINGHIYIAGFTSSSNNIGTTGAYQTTAPGGYDAFLVQFDPLGNVIWGTYYGGPGAEYNASCYAFGFYVYVAGWTASTTGIASTGCYQPTYGGGSGDGFVVKFDDDCNRVWGSYYGGPAAETMGGITVAQSGDVYILGSTGSLTGIATTGCFQPDFGGGPVDAFLMKLDPELGHKDWGTYYGGESTEYVDLSRMTTDPLNNVLITGYTTSLTGIASTGAWQATNGGGQDGFFAKFSSDGLEEWSTYYGGSGTDAGQACGFDGVSIYLGGETSSPNNIATTDGFMSTGGGGPYYEQGFLAKFLDMDTVVGALGVPAVTARSPQFSLFPSPNHGTFSITGSYIGTDGQAEASITDSRGVEVWRGYTSVTNGSFNRQIILNAGLPAGEYFLRMVTGSDVKVLNFMKE